MVFLGAVVVLVVKSFGMACTGAVMSGNAANGHVGQSSTNSTPSQPNSRPFDLPGHFSCPQDRPMSSQDTPPQPNLYEQLAPRHFLTTHSNQSALGTSRHQSTPKTRTNPPPEPFDITRHPPNRSTPTDPPRDPLARFHTHISQHLAVLRNTGAARRTKKTQDGEKNMQG